MATRPAVRVRTLKVEGAMHHAMRCAMVAVLPLVASCQPGASGGNDTYRLNQSAAAAHELVVRLAACPSPLKRLGIAAAPRRLDQPGPDTVILTVPVGDAATAIVLRFKIEASDGNGATVRSAIDLPGSAQELELGEGQLITPKKFTVELGEALQTYFELNDNHDSAYPFDPREKTGQQCRRIGRLLDDGAVMISPALSAEVRRQRRRDAINWLFKDEYQLRSDSSEGNDPYQVAGYGD